LQTWLEVWLTLSREPLSPLNQIIWTTTITIADHYQTEAARSIAQFEVNPHFELPISLSFSSTWLDKSTTEWWNGGNGYASVDLYAHCAISIFKSVSL